MEEQKEELARILTREEGKTLKDALGEVQRVDQHHWNLWRARRGD